MAKLSLKELENVLLDQIEKLSDDSIGDDKEATKLMIDRSKAISELSTNVIALNNMKLAFVKEMNKNGGKYSEVLGIKSEEPKDMKTRLPNKDDLFYEE